MPRFYFHLYQSGEMLVDPEGVVIADLAAVRAEALVAARDLIAADAMTGVIDLSTCLRVVDEANQPVLELHFADAVAFVSGRELRAVP